MEPKEKAKELVEKYADALPNVFYNVVESKNYYSAKECSLIAVDEILKVAFFSDDKIYNFYLEVKKEIEKL